MSVSDPTRDMWLRISGLILVPPGVGLPSNAGARGHADAEPVGDQHYGMTSAPPDSATGGYGGVRTAPGDLSARLAGRDDLGQRVPTNVN
jgi:hypothetical protein